MTKNAYATKLTKAMTARDVTLRDIERALEDYNYSYEHIRAIVAGENISFAQKFNDAVCDYLDLDKQDMWELAQSLRIEKKYGSRMRVVAPPDNSLKSVWADLTNEQKAQIVKIATGMAEQNRVMSYARTA